MNTVTKIKKELLKTISSAFNVDPEHLKNVEVKLNIDSKNDGFGDLSCNAALVLASLIKQSPRQIADTLKSLFTQNTNEFIEKIEIAGPGFLNITLTKETWRKITLELFYQNKNFFKLEENSPVSKYLVEFVSANPTGPLHLGTGRGGIIGDVLANVLKFLGHIVQTEYYINDAGNQISALGESFKIRCFQQLGRTDEMPENGYNGEYLIELAKECVSEYDEALLEKDDLFFQTYAKEHMLQLIKHDLKSYGIHFDQWFSEKSLHESGVVPAAIKMLKDQDMAYEQDGAIWFKSTQFGDDKDRVMQKSSGELTYIANDIAYHKDKFDRGFDVLIDVLGQDHHGYVKRLKATMEALGYNPDHLDVILYQLVTIKQSEEIVRMSKRSGTFTKLSDVIDAVGTDVARFFYLNRKAEAHLEFDIDTAMKKDDENPVFYIQYAYVRTISILQKAEQESELVECLKQLKDTANDGALMETFVKEIGPEEYTVLKKIISLQDVLNTIASTYQTHILAYYAWELANKFHVYYANNRVIDLANIPQTKARLLTVVLVKQTLDTCLDLLGLSKPEKM